MELARIACGVFAALSLCMTSAGYAQTRLTQESGSHLDALFAAHDVQGTFVLFDPKQDQWVYHDETRAHTQYLPASTFKIPNSLIALETQVASGPDFQLAWDSDKDPRASWWPASWTESHTLHTALQQSVVWYFQEIARQVGQTRMQSYVDQFDYGNRDISGGIDQFWLTGDLRISAEQQVSFLERFYQGELGASQTNVNAVKAMLVLEETPQYRLSGKTGWVGFGETGQPQLGWLVGYLERGEDVYFYAMNIDLEQQGDGAKRLAITKEAFKRLSLM
ncbi:class D beta-lactamase [Pseudomonas abyssi]|uniref:class D beta-lactamase n=1 Tax=Pseudomonas abyssi TaxID=170540 RepID=UPI003C7AE652